MAATSAMAKKETVKLPYTSAVRIVKVAVVS
jgi:hypothetical protein